MSNKYQNSNLVIKNGIYLFLRLLFVLFLGFFTTRITLQVLGDEKFGIYNIVGGIIAVFAIVSMPIRDSLQRFFNVEFTNERIKPGIVFFTSERIVRWMILIIAILYETVGLFLINFVIKYPSEEHLVVNIIFQITVLSNIYGFASLPYLSLLFAKENMGVPAICEIVGAVLKIILIYLIPYIPVDVLIPYASIFLLIHWATYVFYRWYSKHKYVEGFLIKEENLDLRKSMLSFSGWSFIEAVAGIGLTYVSNIFINVFGGVLYNTAYGISKQLQNSVVSFSSNVMKAADPQITSSTTSANDHYRNQLVLTSSKISFLVVSFIYIVFHFDGAFLLDLWLDKVPNYSLAFCDLAILATVFTSISLPYRTLIMATGRVKNYFLSYGAISLVAMVIMFIGLKLGAPIISAMYIIMLSSVLMWIVAVFFSLKYTTLSFRSVFNDFFRQLFVVVCSAITYYFVSTLFNIGFVRLLVSILTSFIVLSSLSYIIALNEAENNKIKQLISRIIPFS